MSAPDDEPILDLRKLTPEQRRQIYKEEMRVVLRQNLKLYGVLYLVGCLIAYSGLFKSAIDWANGATFDPELDQNFFHRLIEGACMVMYPFIMDFIAFWLLVVPAAIAMWIWSCWKRRSGRCQGIDDE